MDPSNPHGALPAYNELKSNEKPHNNIASLKPTRAKSNLGVYTSQTYSKGEENESTKVADEFDPRLV